MAKIIEYTDGIGAMRGSLSPKQTLLYAKNNNPAYYSPEGKSNAARNYKANFIGMKDNATGRTRFAVRNRYAVNMTATAKKAMALLGGAASYYAACMADDMWTQMVTCYEFYKDQALIPNTETIRQFWIKHIRYMLQANLAEYKVPYLAPLYITLRNPFMDSDYAPTVPNGVLLKFFGVLNNDPHIFTIDGDQGIDNGELDMADIIGSEWNVLGLTTVQVSGTYYVKYKNLFVIDRAGNYMTDNVIPADGEKYQLTSTSPA